MTVLLTAAEMREIERAAMESGSATGRDLMERAGRGAVEAMIAEWPHLDWGAARAHVLCGPGNNGGDGYVIARLLRARGWRVRVFASGAPADAAGDAAANAVRWSGPVETLADLPPDGACDVIVDALFGTGLSRGVEDLRAAREGRGERVVAIDVPSGLCADSGRVLCRADGSAAAFFADLTVTFHARKRGHVLADGPRHCGRVRVVDIGLVARPARAALVTAPDRDGIAKHPGAHKYDHGHALVLAGGAGKGGAARIAARGALRVGAGLVTLGVAPSAMFENAMRLDAIMLARVPDADALAGLLDDGRISALVAGPGLGLDDRAGEMVGTILDARRPTLLDADAITLLAGDATLRSKLHRECVLTPHMGEFGRLCPEIQGRLSETATRGPAYSQADAAAEAAASLGAVVLLKGPATIVAGPDGGILVNAAVGPEAAPWLATAGAGDALAGIVGGLLARGFAGVEAAATGAWLHAEAARRFGPGLIAEDLPEMLPRVFADLENRR